MNINNSKKRISIPIGARLTPVRKVICSFFDQSREPVDCSQIISFLENQGFKVNKTTVYRQLDFLLKEGLIHALDFGEGKKRYELVGDHHHHLICTRCEKIECFEVEENFRKQETDIYMATDFKVTGHLLEFLGICKKCQKNVN